MSMFDSIINEAGEKFNLGGKSGTLLSALLALMTDKNHGGFAGFLEKFNAAGLGDTASSWIGAGSNTPVSNEQIESALGEETLQNVADQTGTDYDTAASATAFMTPRVVDALTPGGVIPQEGDLLTNIGGYLTGGAAALDGIGITTKSLTGGLPDKADAAVGNTFEAAKGTVSGGINAVGDTAGAVGDRVGSGLHTVGDNLDGDNGSILKWLIPLLLLGLLIVLGYMFCGKSAPVVTTNANVNANSNKAVVVNNNSAVKTVDSSVSIKADNGKYVVTGEVADEATKKQIVDALTKQYGAENVDFSGLKVNAAAKPFGAGWWANFAAMLPNLKDWKTGELSFAGSAVTAASGLPEAAIAQLKSLFGAGWTLPASITGATTGERKLTEVSLPAGTKLQAYPGGIEDQLIKFIQSDEYKNGTADTLKDKWFSFDDLNFKTGTTELVPESKRQLDNVVAILKGFPDVKIKIGGYTDKTGNDAANKKLSDERAKAVKAALEKAGVGAQVPEAEGYGEEFAKVAETATDKEREADRKTSVRLLK